MHVGMEGALEGWRERRSDSRKEGWRDYGSDGGIKVCM